MSTPTEYDTPVVATRKEIPQAAVLQSINETIIEEFQLFTCGICFHLMEAAKITKCGHSYCSECISQCIETCHKCPQCSTYLIEDDVYSNLYVDELIEKHKERLEISKFLTNSSRNSQETITLDTNEANLPGINSMIELLTRRKTLLEKHDRDVNHALMCEFLARLIQGREEQKEGLDRVYKVLKHDLVLLQEALHSLDIDCSENENKNLSANMHVEDVVSTEQRHQLYLNFENLKDCYIETRMPNIGAKDQTPSVEGFRKFYDDVENFARYTSMKQIAMINLARENPNNINIISSIAFNKDNDYFALAGVMRKIKIYKYHAVINNPQRDNPSVGEMMCTSKISCISWSMFKRNYLASADYEGSVILWDTETQQEVKIYHEHEKRCWSVDFNSHDSKMLATASDDRTVKLWSTDANNSFATINAKTNVCSVQFNPHSSCHLAFGASDHRVHYYDVRNLKKAICVHEGHSKAVSYVKFLNQNEIVSASTDAKLCVWNVNRKYPVRSLSGHINDKNFIGLATNGDYIVCGSENNSLYFYYKKMIRPLFTYEFGMVLDDIKDEIYVPEDSTNGFVSAVCWRPNSNVWIAANGQGLIKVLELN